MKYISTVFLEFISIILVGVHYNHCVSPSVRYQLVKMLITLEILHFDQILHTYTFEHFQVTGMQTVTRLCRAHFGRSRSLSMLSENTYCSYCDQCLHTFRF